MMRALILGTIVLVLGTGCTPVQVHPDSVCSWYKVIRPSRTQDQLSAETAKQIKFDNDAASSICGWR